MRAAKVQASLRVRAVSPEPSLLAHTSSESRGTFRQKARSLAPLNGWACAVKICYDGMLEDTNSLDGAHLIRNVNHSIMTSTVAPFSCIYRKIVASHQYCLSFFFLVKIRSLRRLQNWFFGGGETAITIQSLKFWYSQLKLYTMSGELIQSDKEGCSGCIQSGLETSRLSTSVILVGRVFHTLMVQR